MWVFVVPDRESRIKWGNFAVFPQAARTKIAVHPQEKFILHIQEDSWQQA
jgi:hypothetical protein